MGLIWYFSRSLRWFFGAVVSDDRHEWEDDPLLRRGDDSISDEEDRVIW